MKLVALALMAIALITGLIIRGFVPEAEGAYAIVGLAVLLGALLLLTDWVVRVVQGKIRLRPLDATKKVLVIFPIMLGARLAIWAVFPTAERDLTSALIQSAAFAIPFSLYTTAYRKPA